MNRHDLISQKTVVRRQIEQIQRELESLYPQDGTGAPSVAHNPERRQESDWLSRILQSRILQWWTGKRGKQEREAFQRQKRLQSRLESLMAEEYRLRNAIDRSR